MAGLLTGMLLAASALATEPAAHDEHRTRASFLFRLAFFVTWPSSAFAEADQAITLCIVGTPDLMFVRALQTEVVGRKVRKRPLRVEQRTPPDQLQDCHIAYASGLGDSVINLDSAFVSVVDSRELLRHTGMLALVREQTAGASAKLVFHGRRDRISASPIELSAQLMQLVRFDEPTP